MANKYYVITGNPQLTQKNRNQFYAKVYQDNLYVIEDNMYGQNWLKNKNKTEKTLEEANAIITARNEATINQWNETRIVEQSYMGDSTVHAIDASIVKPDLQDLITEE